MSTEDKREGFIDLLLVVIGLVFAGASDLQNKGFYYAVFAFLASALFARILITFEVNKKSSDETSLYNTMFSLASFIMAISFPLVFVFYFYVKLFPDTWNNEILLLVVLFCFALITAGFSVLTFISLTQNINQRFDLCKYEKIIFSSITVLDDRVKKWLCFFVKMIIIEFALLIMFLVFMKDNSQSPDYIIQNANVIINNSTVTVT